ncbi:BrnT family toxin [Candidatus Gottesmanbacteria bacterium]|nr:BrnT family toxin [Candidatus Roizmanbacteria bacterium]MBI4066811.1 BrnT family toxin [Candidatus Gottesmanbacteria bacterium]
MRKSIDISRIEFSDFNWDKGNWRKNWLKHKVTTDESEEIFYNEPILFFRDEQHSQKEDRFIAYGITDKERLLTVVFTIRKTNIRIISARDQSKKERRIYETKKNTQI